MEGGDLAKHLKESRDIDALSLVSNLQKEPVWRLRISRSSFLSLKPAQVASGLEYLHTYTPAIIHGDLRAVRFLLLLACFLSTLTHL